MATWREFAEEMPGMAAEARELFYQYGLGLGFLATIRADGGPRLHPICPIITDEGLYTFIVPSPKRRDLQDDGRFALHALSPEDIDDECYLAGHALLVEDPMIRTAVAEAYHHDPSAEEDLYELRIDRCMIARYRHRGDWPPTYTTWVDERSGSGGRPVG